MSTHLKAAKTVEQIKSEYRKLVLNYSDREDFLTEIKTEYLKLLESLDGTKTKGADGKEYLYKFNLEIEDQVGCKLQELVALQLSGVRIMLVGTWIWIDGDTKPVRAALKAAGCRWIREREKWSWHVGPYRRTGRPEKSFEELAEKYGYQEVQRLRAAA